MTPTLYMLSLTALALVGAVRAQAQDLFRGGLLKENVRYHVATQGQTGTATAALYANANRYGLSSLNGHAGYLRAGFTRDVLTDSARHWRMGFGLDVAALAGHTSSLTMHQAYVDVAYDAVQLTLGAKEQPMHLKHPTLSSGGLTLGKNSRPLPELRIAIPHYITLDRGGWVALKGHVAFGRATDGNFQKRYVAAGQHYVDKAWVHTKSGFVRVGNAEKFPLTLEGGLEMAAQYGGTIYNLNQQGITDLQMSQGLQAMWRAFVAGGSDATDEGYDNAQGNTLGSWLMAVNYHGKGWKVRAYYDHFFEDHSQLFMEYGWKDGLWGMEVELPKNPIAQTLVYEHITTLQQTGPVYHDHTAAIPDQISGRDMYYHHALYGSWSHWGQYVGNPLFITPLYRNDGTLRVQNNRFTAHHLGLSGQPLPTLGYRVLATFTNNYGTYDHLYERAKRGQHYLLELDYQPKYFGRRDVEGWRVKLGVALDRGAHLGNHTTMMLTIGKSGSLFH